MDILGDVIIKVDGKVLKSIEGSGRLNVGGPKGTTRKGGGRVYGASRTTMASVVSCDMLPDAEFDHEAIQEIREATIEFVDSAGGPGWVISRAWFIEFGEIEEGEDSKVPVTFNGVPAQKV